MRLLTRAACLTLALPLSSLGAQSRVTAAEPRASAIETFQRDRLARIDSLMIRLVAEQKLPGAVVMLVKDGSVAYHKAFGYRDVTTKAPLRRDDIFRIASQTKAITSLAVMMLWEEGKFGLDDPVSRYLPEFDKQRVLTKFNPADSSFEAKPAQRRSTIRQLLTHTSGLDYADIGSEEFKAIYAKAGLTALGREGDVLADKVRILGGLPLQAEPGERFIYSLGIDVLGRLVEVWSGMPLDAYVRTRILTPLGMQDSGYELPADRRSRLVTLHSEDEGVLKPMVESAFGMRPDFPARRMTYFAGGAGMSGTTADYARFLQLFLNGGELDGTRLLSRKTVEMMLTNQIPRLPTAFGLGFALETPENDYRNVLSVGSFSWSGAFNTFYWADPKENLVALVYTNVLGSTFALSDRFRTLVYSAMR
ncbi:MAG: serine hydrolase domain-containing protein [Gemmatimonadota bacterium]